VIKGVIAPLAPSWGWIVAANVLLGVNQGLAWSIGHIMKIDLVGPRPRARRGTQRVRRLPSIRLRLRPEPFYLGFGYVVLGLLASVFLVRDKESTFG
jgi:hypothetical protein